LAPLFFYYSNLLGVQQIVVFNNINFIKMTTTTKKDLKIIEAIKKSSIKLDHYYGNNKEESFLNCAKDYISAIRQQRMICIIKSVSKSGMSRVLNFHSFQKTYVRNYYSLFIAVGYKKVDNGFRISGCGMDMIFHTNYTIIHKLHRLGLINKKECDQLAQMTPINLS
jgi:hypothetical protein